MTNASSIPPLCLDLAIPESVDVGAWPAEGDMRVVTGADKRRVLVYAAPGTRIFMMGFPPEDLDVSEVGSWFEANPIAKPVWFDVDQDGEARRLAGRQRIPAKAMSDPRLKALAERIGARPRSEKSEVPVDIPISESPAESLDTPAPSASVTMEADPSPDRPAGVSGGPREGRPAVAEDTAESQVEAVAPPAERESATDDGELPIVHRQPAVEGGTPRVHAVYGEPLESRILEDGEVVVRAGEDVAFVLGFEPTDVEDPDSWLDENRQARTVGYRVKDGLAIVDLSVLAAFERRLQRRGEEGLDAPWGAMMMASEDARTRALHGVAVPATGLRKYVEERKRPPRAIVGTDGTLYVRVLEPFEPGISPAVSAVVPATAPAQGLVVEVRDEASAGRHLFLPVQTSFILAEFHGGTDAPPATPDEGVAYQIRPAGDVYRLPSSERALTWSEARPLELIEANPLRRQSSPKQQTAAPPPSTEKAEPSNDTPPPELWDGPLPEISDEEVAEMNEAFPSEVPMVEGNHEPAASEPEVEDLDVTWRDAIDGPFPTLANWRARSPRGELWLSELLTALSDDPDELDQLGCLVPIQLLRAGHRLTRSDLARMERAARGPFLERLAEIRVFEIEGHTYFARHTGEGVRVVGRRGAPARSQSVRQAIAASYGLANDSAILDPQSYQPATARGLTLNTRSPSTRSASL